MRKKNTLNQKELKDFFDELSSNEIAKISGGEGDDTCDVMEKGSIYIAPPPPGTIGSGIGIRF